MDEQDWLAQRFEEHRSHLRAVAYRMLGSLSEADDAVQEAWLRLSGRQLKFVDTSRPLSTERRGLGRRRVVSRYINELANGTTKSL
jgi:DNA-directed RNA polymerase specialized sigma24 family protein